MRNGRFWIVGMVCLATALLSAGCVNTRLRAQLASRQVAPRIDNYTTAKIESTETGAYVASANIQWVDHTQGRSMQTTLDQSTTLRGWRAPTHSFQAVVPLCDSYPERCAWTLRVGLSLIGIYSSAEVDLKTIDNELIDHLEASPRVVAGRRTTSPAVAARYGVNLSEGEAIWLLDQPRGCEGSAALVTKPLPAGDGEMMRRFVVAKDLVLGTCDGGPAIVTLKAGSFIEFTGPGVFAIYKK